MAQEGDVVLITGKMAFYISLPFFFFKFLVTVFPLLEYEHGYSDF